MWSRPAYGRSVNDYNILGHVASQTSLRRAPMSHVFASLTLRHGDNDFQFCCSNLKSPKRFNAIKALFGSRIHLERAKGNDCQNQTYCSKSGNYIEFGVPHVQGRRSDLQEVIDLVKGGERNLENIAEKCPAQVIKFYKGIEKYISLVQPVPDRDFKTEFYFYWGPPGTGKSSRCLNEAKATGEAIYYKPRGEWWDGYKQQPNVVIDDFYGWIKYDDLLKITDRYPYRVPVKGGFEIFNTKRIWMTSNVSIEEIYRFVGYKPDALQRRITINCYMN